MSATLNGSALSAFAILHAKPFAAAEDAAERLVAAGAMTEDEALEALESHPGKNVPIPQAGKRFTSKQEVLAALANSEITVEAAMVALKEFEPKGNQLPPVLNLEEVARHPTRALGSKGNIGWYFGGKTTVDGKRCQVSINVVILKDKPKK